MVATFTKDPDAVLDYTTAWRDWLDVMDDTLTSHTMHVDDGITLDSSQINSDEVTIDGESYPANTVVTAWFSGGTQGENYDATYRIVTSDGRTDDRTITIKVRER